MSHLTSEELHTAAKSLDRTVNAVIIARFVALAIELDRDITNKVHATMLRILPSSMIVSYPVDRTVLVNMYNEFVCRQCSDNEAEKYLYVPGILLSTTNSMRVIEFCRFLAAKTTPDLSLD